MEYYSAVDVNNMICVFARFVLLLFGGGRGGEVLVAEWLSHSAVVQEDPGSNPGGAESVGD